MRIGVPRKSRSTSTASASCRRVANSSPWAFGAGRERAGRGIGVRRALRAAGATIPPTPPRSSTGRHDRQGQGAAGRGAPVASSGPGAVHLPASGARSRAGPGSRGDGATASPTRPSPAAGGLPLLTPMSEVAGRMSIQAGALLPGKAHGGGRAARRRAGRRRRRWWFWAAAWSAPRDQMRWAWPRDVAVLDRTSTCCAGFGRISASAHAVFSTRDAVERPSSRPISSSAPCWCRAQPPRSSSRPMLVDA